MNGLIEGIIIYFILLAIVLFSNYKISTMNERYDASNQKIIK